MQLSVFAENTIDCASTILLYQLYKFDFKNYDRERSKKKIQFLVKYPLPTIVHSTSINNT